jgi:MarR family 2-MHQ and catechol resistance regulon transcriptional repressor
MKTGITGPAIRGLLRHAEWSVAADERRFVRANCGVGESDFRVLGTLLNHGALPVSAIGRKVLLTSGSITSAVDRLEKRGLVCRSRNPNDRRISVIELTPIGREMIETADVQHAEMLENLVSTLSEAEKSQLANILQKLTK